MRAIRFMRLILSLAVLLCVPATAVRAGGQLTGISVRPAGEATEVILSATDSLTWNDFQLDAPARIVVDLEDTFHRLPKYRFLGLDRGGIRAIRTSQFRDDITRVVLDVRRRTEYSILPSGTSLSVVFRNPEGTFAPWRTGVVAPASASGPVTASPEPETPDVGTTPSPTEPVVEPSPVDLPRPEPIKRITVDFQGADIQAVIRAFSEFSGASIVAGRAVEGRVTAKISDLPWERAFEILMRANGYGVEEREGIYRVDKLEVLRGEEALQMLSPTVFRLNYIDPADIEETVKSMLSERGSVHSDVKTNSLIVSDVPDRVALVGEIILELDVATRQVTIQSKLLFVNSVDLRQLGVQWQGTNFQDPTTDTHGQATSGQSVIDPFLQLTYGTIKAGTNLTGILEALEERQVVDVQAEPQITTLDNLEAQVFVGEKTPIRVLDVGAQTSAAASIQLIETGIKLTVTPHITNDGKIIMELHAERSSAVSVPTEFGVEFQTQEGRTTLLVNDGQTAVIGGLTTVDTVKTRRGVPFLSHIPVLGSLFRFSGDRLEKKDLLIFVTPYIVS